MSERNLQFRVGLFVITAVGIAGALIIQFGEVQKYWKKTYAIAVHFEEARGTHPGCPVRMNGVTIGEVSQVILSADEPGVLVVLQIHEDRRIRRDAQPALVQSLFGDAAIEFSGGQSPEYLAPNKRLNGLTSQDPMKAVENLEKTVSTTLASFEATSREWQSVGRNINTLVETERGSIDDVVNRAAIALDTFTQTMQNASRTMTTASHTLESTNRLLDDPELQANLKRTIATLPQMAEETRQTIVAARSSIQKMSENLDKLSMATDPLAEQSQTLVSHLNGSLRQLESLLTELNEVATAVNHGDGSLKKFAENPELYNNLNKSAASLSLLLKNIEPIMADVRVFSDRVARHPELLGVGGALRGSSGSKNPDEGIEQAGFQEPVKPVRRPQP